MCELVMQAFNIILNFGRFPKSWKDGIIIPVHKHGIKLDVNKYGGITISRCLGKFFCHVINDRISKELERKYLIKSEQAEFREKNIVRQIIFIC